MYTLVIADIMFTPVVLRFVTYLIPVSGRSQELIETVCALESVQRWIDAARVESESLQFIDDLVGAKDSPLTLG